MIQSLLRYFSSLRSFFFFSFSFSENLHTIHQRTISPTINRTLHLVLYRNTWYERYFPYINSSNVAIREYDVSASCNRLFFYSAEMSENNEGTRKSSLVAVRSSPPIMYPPITLCRRSTRETARKSLSCIHPCC